jgi:chemotaxis protein MotA
MKKVFDLATLIGIFAGVLLILLTIMAGSGLGAFINIPSLLVVIGGTIAAVLVQYPLGDVLSVISIMRNTLLTKVSDPNQLIEQIVSFAEEARRDGLLVLEQHSKNIDDQFIKDGIQLAIDGTEPEILREILNTELTNLESRHNKGHGILEAFGAFAPAFGMIGTLIGLVIMLQNMSDPSSIGPAMAVALITTFYGSVMANLIFLPLAGKLKTRTKEELLVREMILEGILSIQSGDNPRLVAQKLNTFLPPKKRKNGESESE